MKKNAAKRGKSNVLKQELSRGGHLVHWTKLTHDRFPITEAQTMKQKPEKFSVDVVDPDYRVGTILQVTATDATLAAEATKAIQAWMDSRPWTKTDWHHVHAIIEGGGLVRRIRPRIFCEANTNEVEAEGNSG